jgi:cell division protein FtsZ
MLEGAMGISIEFAEEAQLAARIKVVGVGGSGGNALNTMIASGLEGVEFIAANTDHQALDTSLASVKVPLGPQLTKGLGAGGNPEVGRKAALEDVQRMAEALSGADMVFVTAGMGGGTGTGAAPIVAQIARDQGALTVAVVTKPFDFEGRKRGKNADMGLAQLCESVDAIITIPNQKLLGLEGEDDLSLLEAFQRADDVLLQAVKGIADLILQAGMINVDFADVRTIMANKGRSLMGTGYGKGERRALDAAEMAINSPLLDNISVHGATDILINFTAGPDFKLKEVHEASTLIQQAAHEEAHIIFGVVTDPDMSDTVKMTVIATGFDDEAFGSGAPPHEVVHASRPSRVTLPMQRPLATRPSVVPAMAVKSDHPSRRFSSAPQQTSLAEARPSRAFGPSALHDESVLEIPAYLRRNAASGGE